MMAAMGSRVALAMLFVAAGSLHFAATDGYERIVPSVLPRARELVWISGVAEMAGGIGLLVPRTRRLAGIALIALLVAIFPANVNMALNPELSPPQLPHALLWVRLPLQAVLVWWVWRATVRRGPPLSAEADPPRVA
jgi:uncharacterized membrane protein